MGRSRSGQYLIYIGVFIGCLLVYMQFQAMNEGFEEKKNPKGIIVELIGGLGNQLYIYSAAKMIQKAVNIPVYLKLADESVNSTFNHSETDYRPILFSEFKAVDSSDPMFGDKIDVRVEDKFWDPWSPSTIPLTTDKYIYIPNQWYQHLPSIQLVLPEVKSKILGTLQNLYKDTIVKQSTAFMHVRRGDYTEQGNTPYLLDIDYYLKALKHLNSRENITTINVFSDDIAWCKQQGWDSPKQIIFIDEPDEMKALYMMSQCTEGAIISNSTFSTWGALLGASESGVVVYPSKWLYGAETAFPTSWIRI
jgi:hypothetical protein